MTVRAVEPFAYDVGLNFKSNPYHAWNSLGYPCVSKMYPPRGIRSIVFNYDLIPTLWHKGDVRLCFVEAQSIYLDTCHSVFNHEVIPFIWDCWPCYYEKVERWLRKHRVRCAIFTSLQEMEAMHLRCPDVQMYWCHEGIDTEKYKQGKILRERSIDYLAYGRCSRYLSVDVFDEGIKVISSDWYKELYNQESLANALSDSKVVLCLSKYYTDPEISQGIDTLTQRFWECLLSGIVVVGHAPRELIDVMGYNPVVELESDDSERIVSQIQDIVLHIEDYQELVCRNRRKALQIASWETRMKEIIIWLKTNNYG